MGLEIFYDLHAPEHWSNGRVQDIVEQIDSQANGRRKMTVIDQREAVEKICAIWACGTAARISPPPTPPGLSARDKLLKQCMCLASSHRSESARGLAQSKTLR